MSRPDSVPSPTAGPGGIPPGHRDDLEFLIDPPACSVYNSAVQVVATSTAATLLANSENFDNASMHCGTLYALAEGEVPSAELSFARAAALSKAGRHHEAAAALEAGIPYASPGAAREAALQTAIELVAAGEMQRGVAAFEALLGRFGEKLRPRSTRALVAFSLLWLVCTWFFRDLLRLRECHPPREAPDDYFRLQLYDAIGHHLLIIDPLVAARFGVKHTRLARRLGQQAHVGRARIAHATRIAAVFGQWGRRRAYLHLDRGEALCAEAGDARGLLDGLFARGIIHLHEGNVTGLRRIAAEAETLARERGLFEDPTLMMLRNIHLGGEYFAGDLPGTVERAEAYLREARLRANALELGEATQILGLAKLMMGDGPSGRAYLEEALTLIPEKPLILARLRLELSAVELCLFLGDYPRGRERLALTKAHRRKVGAGLSGLDRALLAVQEGRLELAARGPGEPLPGSFGGLRLRILANIAPPVLRPVMRRFSAAVHYRRGDTKGALRELDESLRFSEHCNNLLGAGMALAARATVRRAAGLDGADLDARRASELLRSLGASGCYLLRAEGWADPDAGPGVQKR